MSEINILLVDDISTNLDVLRRTLEPEGYKISIAPSGEIALKIVPRLLPDLILLDVLMPGMDGFETCSSLKKDENTKRIPIIFITAKNETEDIVRGFQVGGVDYIVKPFRQEEVCARTRTQLRIQELIKEKEGLVSELEVKNQHLINLDSLKNKFMGMAAHDLRNPLSSIRGFSEIMLDETGNLGSENNRELIKIINSVSEDMLTLVNDLLDVSIIESGELKLHTENASLEEIVKERIRIIEVIAEKKYIHFHLSSLKVPETIFDQKKIGQVIDNLLSNAIKYSPAGSNIYVTIEREEDDAKICIRDEGPGISPDDQLKICGFFQKLSAQPTGEESSTGLGLAIAKKIVESHQGKLKLKSQLGVGSMFYFTIPLNSAG